MKRERAEVMMVYWKVARKPHVRSFFFYISVSIGILMYTLSCMATYSQEYIRIDKLANNTQWIEHIQNE